MKSDPLFSLIIPTYNRGKYIIKTIETVLSQDYTNFEIIIVDDGSTDDTAQLINKLSNNKIVYFKIQNSERAAARNYGIKRAKGDYISFLDSDDQLLPNHYSEAIKLIQKHNNPEVFHLHYYIESGNNKKQEAIIPIDISKEIMKGNPFSANGIFLRCDIAINNLFNEDRELSASEDYELWTRLVARYPIYTNKTPTSVVYMHDDRSVLIANEHKLIKRVELYLKYAFTDEFVKIKYENKKHIFKAYFLTYVALHLILCKNKLKGLSYLMSAFIIYPKVIFERRSLACIKRLLISL